MWKPVAKDKLDAAVSSVQEILRKFHFRVHWGSYWHEETAGDLFETFDDDLGKLKALLQKYEDNKFINCWSERLIFNKDCRYSKETPVLPDTPQAAGGKAYTDEL